MESGAEGGRGATNFYLSYVEYSGAKYESLSGATMVGGEIYSTFGKEYAQFFSAVGAGLISGQVDLMDGATASALNLTSYLANVSLGGVIYLASSSSLVRPYLGFGGSGQVIYTSLPSGTYTELQESETQLGTGYFILLGADLKAPWRKLKTLSWQARLNHGSVNLFNNSSFSLEGMHLLFGLGF